MVEVGKPKHYFLGERGARRRLGSWGKDSLFIKQVRTTRRGPELILSRSSLNFVRKLFEMEVAEIADGTVSLAAMAREPGYRTKVCEKYGSKS